MRTKGLLAVSWAVSLICAGALSRVASGQTFTGFGDSITYGFSSSWGDGYIGVYAYYNSWELPAVLFENQGLPDEKTDDGLVRIPQAIAATNPTHIFIMEGTNDVNAGYSAASIVFNLEAMAAYADGQGVLPVMGSIPPRKSSDVRDPGNAKAASISSQMKSFAQANGYPFGAVFDAFMNDPDPDGLLDDRVHPNDWGHIIMARAWHAGVRPLFGPPTVTAVTPNWGVLSSPTQVDITGTSLANGMQGYLFNMTENPKVTSIGAVSVLSSTQATMVIPAGLQRTFYDVVVASPGGGGAIIHDGFSATWNAPVITAVIPDRVASGVKTTVTLQGQDLQNGSTVYFGGQPGTNFTWASISQVSVDNPVLAPGAYDIRFVCPDRAESTLTNAFYSLGAPPTITSVTPPQGQNTAAVPITVNGSGFDPAAELLIGTTALTSVTVTSAARIDAVVGINFPAGTHDVTVRNPDSQTATLAGGYTSLDPPPIINTVTPSTVEAGERTVITLDGDLFKTGARVFAGGTELVEVVFVTAQQLRATTTQTIAAGVYDVTVQNPSGQSGTKPAALTVADTKAPVLARAYPAANQLGAPLQPRFDLLLTDRGSGVDPASIAITVNGTPQTALSITLGPKVTRVSFQPPTPLAASTSVAVTLSVADAATPPSTLSTGWSFTISDTVDGDGDGLPSDWEAAHGLDPAGAAGANGATGDRDRDTTVNDAEYGGGTDPTSPDLLSVAPGPGATNVPRAGLFLATGERLDATMSPPPGGYGLNLALGDLSEDGASELLTGPGPSPNYGPQVRAFQSDLTPIAKVNFFAYGTLKYGVKVAAGAIEGGLRELIVTGPGPGAVFGPQVRAFRFDTTLTSVAKVNFFAYQTLKYGVTPGTGFLDADAAAEIVTAAPPAPVFGPHIRGFNYDGQALAAIAKVSFFAFGTPRYGVAAACGDVDGDLYDEILAGAGPSPSFAAQVKGFDFDGASVTAIPGFNLLAFSGMYGVKVASGDIDSDGRGEVVAGAGEDPVIGARVRTYHWSGGFTSDGDFFAWDGTGYGANVAAGDPGLSP